MQDEINLLDQVRVQILAAICHKMLLCLAYTNAFTYIYIYVYMYIYIYIYIFYINRFGQQFVKIWYNILQKLMLGHIFIYTFM